MSILERLTLSGDLESQCSRRLRAACIAERVLYARLLLEPLACREVLSRPTFKLYGDGAFHDKDESRCRVGVLGRRCAWSDVRDPHMGLLALHFGHIHPQYFSALEGWLLGIEASDYTEGGADGKDQARNYDHSLHA